MALVNVRATFARAGGLNVFIGAQLHPLNVSKMAAAPCLQQVAGLKACHGKPKTWPQPWPYKERPFNLFWQIFADRTDKRLTDESKLIVVDGNIASGKSEFAKKLAEELDFRYIPEIEEKELYTIPGYEFDIRNLNDQLSSDAKIYDLEAFYKDPNPQCGKVGRVQIHMYRARLLAYADALAYILNTGRGVVMDRSVYSDMVFADALRKMKYMTPQAHKFYWLMRDNSICEMWKPHLVIYLDSPVSKCRDRIKQRNIPAEVNSKVLNDEYLKSLEFMYKQKYLPIMRKYCQVLEYDWTEFGDMELIIEDIEGLDLENAPESHEDRFEDWGLTRDDELAWHRKTFASRWQMSNLMSLPAPYEAPELLMDASAAEEYNETVTRHPFNRIAPGWNPQVTGADVFWKFK